MEKEFFAAVSEAAHIDFKPAFGHSLQNNCFLRFNLSGYDKLLNLDSDFI